MKIYIAGPMTGLPNSNYDAFFAAESHLRLLGYDVVNPATLNHQGEDWDKCIGDALSAIPSCDAIVLLDGWEYSRGAKIEVKLATALGLPFYNLRLELMEIGESKVEYPRVIGIAGFKRAGKTTAAELLVDMHSFHRMSFAAPIKAMCGVIVPQEYLTGDKKEDVIPWLGCTGRKVMQTLGTEWGRQMIADSIWTESLINSQEFNFHKRIVIDDVRFKNEAEAIRKKGGQIWRVERDGCNGDGHVSEREHLGIVCDHVLRNNGSVMELERQIINLLTK